MTNNDTLLLKVIDSFPGTPEELGDCLEEARSNCWLELTEKARQACLERKATARNRILTCEGGLELLMKENAI